MAKKNKANLRLTETEFIERLENDQRIMDSPLFEEWKNTGWKNRGRIAQETVAYFNGMIAHNLIKDYRETENKVFFHEVKRQILDKVRWYSGNTFLDDLTLQTKSAKIIKIKKDNEPDSPQASLLFSDNIKSWFNGVNTRINSHPLLLVTCFFLYDQNGNRYEGWDNVSKAIQEVRQWTTTLRECLDAKTPASETPKLKTINQDIRRNLELSDFEAGEDIDLSFDQNTEHKSNIVMNGMKAGGRIKISTIHRNKANE